MARIPHVTREQLAPEDRPYFDEIAESRGSVRGPYAALMHIPRLAARIGATGAYVRFEADLPDALREVAVLATAREIRAQYEFSAHADPAREAGVSEETIRAIAQGTAPRGLSGDQELVVRYVQELLRDRKVTDATFEAARDLLGVKGIVELTALIGHYLVMGLVLTAFEVKLGPGMKAEFPL